MLQESEKSSTVVLPDGYNGHELHFYRDPIEEWADGTVKLRCVEFPHLFKWARKKDIEAQ